MQRAQTRRNVAATILLITFSRLIINLTRRFPYPFLPEIARQLQVSAVSAQSVLAVSNGIGITSPLFSPLSERFGRKRVMLGAMAMMAFAGVAGALLPQFAVFAGMILAFGFGKMIFDPAMQAYLGDRIPYHRRAMALGTTELSWAGSLFVAAPLVGLLLETAALQTVFMVIAALLLFGMITLWLWLPDDDDGEYRNKSKATTLRASWHIIRHNPEALGGMLYSFFLVMANEMFFINYSLWLELSFELVLTALGTVSLVIAIAEVSGEFVVIGIADKFGKRRLALLGALVAAITYIILPLFADLAPAIIGLFVMFLAVETAIVASIPLFTEILPDARAVMMSGNISAHSIGRLLGATLGGLLFALTRDFALIGGLATVTGLCAFVMMWRFVRE